MIPPDTRERPEAQLNQPHIPGLGGVRAITLIVISGVLACAVVIAAQNGTVLQWCAATIRFDYGVTEGTIPVHPNEIRHVLQIVAPFLWVSFSLCLLAYQFRALLLRLPFASWAVTLGCAWALFICLTKHGFDSTWYPLHAQIHNPTALKVVGHRVLLPWCALMLQNLVPALNDVRAYWVTQAVMCLLASVAVGYWSAEVLGPRFRAAGQALMVVMVSATIGYYTFYDIAIVFFFTAALLCLKREWYAAFVALVGVATLNHENILLVIPVAALILFDTAPRRIWIGVPGTALAAHIAARLLVHHFMANDSAADLRFWTNLAEFASVKPILLKSAITVIPWWIAAMYGFAVSDRFIRRCSVLLPLLIAVTYLFGKFYESRQFDAFVPVAIVGVLAAGRRINEGSATSAAV
jgi:hypothetical protein